MTKYTYGIKRNKTIGFQAVVLADDTHLVIGKQSITFMYPKKKFNKLFKAQMKDRTKRYIGISYNMTEITALLEGIKSLHKSVRERKENTK